MTDIRTGDIVRDSHHLVMGTALKPVVFGRKWPGWLVQLFHIYEGEAMGLNRQAREASRAAPVVSLREQRAK